ncbi:hypothetical protein ACIQVK_44245 [Streptomyces sp. NPDC090493]|uniref:hypothetical protein n=1 Tax=Streptomyces sp. NPDC090493 TaxID=3365964 RepID=UPI0038125799
MAETQTTGIKNADELITLAAAFGLTVTVETTDRETLTSYVVRFAIPVPVAYAGTELGRAIAGDTLTLLWTKSKKKGARGCLVDATVGSVVSSRKARTLRAVTAAVDTLGRSSAKYARDAAPLPEDVVDAPHAVFSDGHQVHAGIPAAHVRTIVKNRRFRGWTFHQDDENAICIEGRRYVPVQPAPAEETPAPAADERQHVRITNDGPAEIIPTREALDEINAAMMQPEVKRTVKRMSASQSSAHIVYRDGRTVHLRPATPGDVFPTPAERPTDAELTGDIDAGLAAYYAETFPAIADGSALPVRADMIRPGMEVIHAHMGETRTVSAVTAFVGPGAPWVRPTWTFRSHDESTTGSTFPPEMHLMVTRSSLDAVFGPASAEDTTPAAPAEAAPLFAALAAYEATVCATSPRDLDDLARHLHAVGKAASTAHHREILEAQADVIEGAWEALRTAGDLRARNAAHDMARTAVERARAVILAVAPHAHRMHGTDVPSTAEEIRAAAVAYNAVGSTAEELSAVETGTPRVRVRCSSDSGTGWQVTATITAGVDTPQGFLPAHPAIVEKFRKVDGREDAAANARRVIGALFRVAVPVEYVRSSRG